MLDPVAAVASSCIESMLDALDNPDAQFPAFIAVDLVVDASGCEFDTSDAIYALFTAAAKRLRDALRPCPQPDRRVRPAFYSAARIAHLRTAWIVADQIISRVAAQYRPRPIERSELESLIDQALSPETLELSRRDRSYLARLHQWAGVVKSVDAVLAQLETAGAAYT
jgi:hypothetical protein